MCRTVSQLPHYDCRYLAILLGCRSARLAGPAASPATRLIVSVFISRPKPPHCTTGPELVKGDQNLISKKHNFKLPLDTRRINNTVKLLYLSLVM